MKNDSLTTENQTMSEPRTEDQETYFKRGAKVKPAQRREIIEANMRPERPPPEAYDLAMANLHKPWARRYLRNFRYIP